MHSRSDVVTQVLISGRGAPSRLGARGLAIVAGVALLVGATALPVWALSISQAYIFSDWSSPTNVSAAPFLLNATAGYQLSLNSSGVATSATAISGAIPVQISDRFYYQSHTGRINRNEGVSSSAMASRVNSEIRQVDDAGLINESNDAALNIDFTRYSSVMLGTSSPNVSVPGLVLFEDAGLDPFSLRYCYNAACTLSDLLFDGFNSSTRSTLLSNPNRFGTNDYAPGIDQAFLFTFDGPATGGYFRIGDTRNYAGERLEVDFVGVATARASVPEPGTLLLLGSALLGLPLFRKIRNS